MTDILCPTCGRPNPEDQKICDFCGSPLLGAEHQIPRDSSPGDDFFSDQFQQFAEPLDESSRLDSLFSEAESPPITPSEQDQIPGGSEDDAFRLDEIFPSGGFDRDQSGPPAEEPADESSRLDDLLAPGQLDWEGSSPAVEEPGDESSRLDDLLSPGQLDWEESVPAAGGTEDESSRLDDLLSLGEFDEEASSPPTGAKHEPSPREDIGEDQFDFRVQRPGDLFSQPDGGLRDEIIPGAEDSRSRELAGQDSSPDDFFSFEGSSEMPAWDPDILGGDEEDALAFEDLFQPQDSGGTSEPLFDPGQDDPLDELSRAQESSDGWEDPLEGVDAPPQGADPEPWSIQPEGQTDDSGEGMDFQSVFPDEDGLSGEGKKPQPQAEQPGDWQEPGLDFGSPGFEEDSGWLDMLQEPDFLEDSTAETPKTPAGKKADTDWLERIKRLNKSSELVDDDSSFPDWLTVSEKPAEEVEEAAREAEEESAAADLPEWLQLDQDDLQLNEFLRKKDLTNEEYKPLLSQQLQAKESLEDGTPPAGGKEPGKPKKFPSWAESGNEPEEIPQELRFLNGTGSPSKPRGVIDPFQIEEEEYIDDLFNEELPEWLTAASALEEPPPFEVEITQGELPGWVEAMRPVVESSDASGLSDDEDYLENYGPLAGIPSVLPAEADIVQDPEKAPRKPLDLVATKAHQDYVNLLKTLLGDETKVKPVQKAAPIQTQRILRWLIAIILLLTIATSIVFGGTVDPADLESPRISTGYSALYDRIQRLYDSQPVLIAFDYQPAAAGELHTAAASVIDHLMEQGVYLSFISTEPTGPALAEYFLATTQADHEYRHTQNYINLGYLPGESAGLLSFLIAPKQIVPLAFDGSNAWESPPLQAVNSIQDFEMILVITDDPNTAKIWIEQVGTILEETPLTMVVSAQVEPLIQPYFRSSPQLLSGYVAGLIDSMNYEQLVGRPNLTARSWLPFNLGIIITVGTVFIGGLANGILSLFSRHRIKDLGEKK